MTPARRLAPLLAAVAIGVVAFAWLRHVTPPFLVTDDGIRDQLLVRDCTDLGRCHLIGPPTSMAGFQHGPVWLDLLAAVRLLGGDMESQRTVVLALLAMGVATQSVVVWRWLGASLALPAAVLLIAALSLDVSTSLLVSPSVAAFPDILTAAGLLCYGLSGRRRFLFVAAFALALGINVHVASMILVAPLLALGALPRPRAWRAVLAAGVLIFATCLFTSSAALRANILGLAQHGRLIPALAAGVASLLLCASLGNRFRRLAWGTRACVVGLVLIAPFALASLWLVFWERHHFGVIYLHPIMAPVAVLAAAIVALPFELAARWRAALRWIPTAASIAVIASIAPDLGSPAALATPGVAESWSLAEAEAVAGAASRRGWSYEDLVFRVQGRDCRELLAAMSVSAPAPGPVASPGRRQLQVVKLRRDDAPTVLDAADASIPLGPTTIAVLREVESWLQPESLRACRAPLGSGQPAVCSAPTQRVPEARSPDRFLFVSRSYPEIHALELLPPYVATYEIPLVPVAGESRELSLTDDVAADRGWRITRVEGVGVEGDLPARRVRLHADSGGEGLVVIEKSFATVASIPDAIDMRYPPCVFETQPGDPLQSLVGPR